MNAVLRSFVEAQKSGGAAVLGRPSQDDERRKSSFVDFSLGQVSGGTTLGHRRITDEPRRDDGCPTHQVRVILKGEEETPVRTGLTPMPTSFTVSPLHAPTHSSETGPLLQVQLYGLGRVDALLTPRGRLLFPFPRQQGGSGRN